MKQSKFFVFFIIIAGFTALLIPFFAKNMEKEASDIHIEASTSENAEITSFDKNLQLQILNGNTVEQISLYEYLIGVVSAEMPNSFPLEALKAQAIAARTFALRQANTEKHRNADVCISTDCCQGWSSSPNENAIQAVAQTDGLVITYQDELIDATYFSCCANRTEAAVAVWGGEIPYLQSVESADSSTAPRYMEEVILDTDYFSQVLTAAYPNIQLSAPSSQWLGKITYTKGGGIDTAIIGGVEISGTSLRSLFSLRSTDINFKITDGEIKITTYGFGHRVGMSQYGAKAMAENSCDFDEILLHYYQDVEICRLYMSEQCTALISS